LAMGHNAQRGLFQPRWTTHLDAQRAGRSSSPTKEYGAIPRTALEDQLPLVADGGMPVRFCSNLSGLRGLGHGSATAIWRHSLASSTAASSGLDATPAIHPTGFGPQNRVIPRGGSCGFYSDLGGAPSGAGQTTHPPKRSARQKTGTVRGSPRQCGGEKKRRPQGGRRLRAGRAAGRAAGVARNPRLGWLLISPARFSDRGKLGLGLWYRKPPSRFFQVCTGERGRTVICCSFCTAGLMLAIARNVDAILVAPSRGAGLQDRRGGRKFI